MAKKLYIESERAARRRRPAVAGLAAVLIALAQTVPLHVHAADGAEAESNGEVQRFCSNISDAARDRRYALQAEELENLRQDVDERIAALEAKRAEYESWLQRRDDFLATAEDGLVSIYSNMRPDAAAERLADVHVELAAAIVMKLEPRTAGEVLNEMESKVAASLTGIIASAANREDPS